MVTLEQITEATSYIISKIDFKPEVGIILGTGLGALVEDIDIIQSLSYKDIPNFPVSTVETHSGKLIFGTLSGKRVIAMQGRFHFYEGYSMQQVIMPVRIMYNLGIQHLFISNAAGGLNKNLELSDIMIIRDHINLFPENPLRGANLDKFGGRFPDMYDAYDPQLIEMAKEIAKEEGIDIKEGVYAGVQGPNLETPAEYRYLDTIGADAVGMSTIPENIAARHIQIPVFAVSVITDLCYPEKLKPAAIPEIIGAAINAEPKMTKIFMKLLEKMD
ncbi:purine-nucleoside phosphorylase [Marivirga harenae]|uniref:purine-nucleoside phosphorylase n=1 Tax=Marivirga harenae TaxID=2010992 RepID=UPI0026DFE30A|nr:purine-nucleoside phosphorylase [Marivirga harenae]WKV13968.1 purine-nucleoside phosphorylase [Marivirga harenae]|tara:strand:- start:290790 stop:291611 length:822 start_codon:yes stop_codon:yes gene_type:complete